MRKVISTKNAPAAIGPYSQAIAASGEMLFCSGQIPLDPKTMTLVGEGDVEAQTHQVLKNLAEVLKEAGTDFSKVVKTGIFLKDMNDFQKVNAIYAEYFNENPPARATVEVSRLPKDVLVEIDAITII